MAEASPCARSPTAFLLVLVALLAPPAFGSPPHLIFVLADDWGFANFGLHRAERNSTTREVATPNADRQANSGLRLERHYSFMYCSPSRCALQTGRNPVHVNVLNSAIGQHNGNGGPGGAGVQGAARDFTGLGERMRSAGYRTAQVGKWNACVALGTLQLFPPSSPLFLRISFPPFGSGMAFSEQTPAGRGYDSVSKGT